MSRAECERGDGESGKHLLLGIIDHSALQQRQHSVGHCLGVESEMTMVSESLHYGIWNSSHTDLQSRAVRNPLGDELTDRYLRLSGRRSGYFHKILVHRHAGIYPGDMHRRIAV